MERHEQVISEAPMLLVFICSYFCGRRQYRALTSTAVHMSKLNKAVHIPRLKLEESYNFAGKNGSDAR